MFSRAIALLSCRFTASKRPQDVVSLFTSFYLRRMSYAPKKYARLKPKLPTLNGKLIVCPFLIIWACPTKKSPASWQGFFCGSVCFRVRFAPCLRHRLRRLTPTSRKNTNSLQVIDLQGGVHFFYWLFDN